MARRKAETPPEETPPEETGIKVGGVYARDEGRVLRAGSLSVEVAANALKIFIGRTQVAEDDLTNWTYVEGGVDLAVVASVVAP